MPLDDATGASVLRKVVEVADMYHACQRKQAALVEAVR